MIQGSDHIIVMEVNILIKEDNFVALATVTMDFYVCSLHSSLENITIAVSGCFPFLASKQHCILGRFKLDFRLGALTFSNC